MIIGIIKGSIKKVLKNSLPLKRYRTNAKEVIVPKIVLIPEDIMATKKLTYAPLTKFRLDKAIIYHFRVIPEGGKIKPAGLKEITIITMIGNKIIKNIINTTNSNNSFPVSKFNLIFIFLTF